jgi:hypothetical protein
MRSPSRSLLRRAKARALARFCHDFVYAPFASHLRDKYGIPSSLIRVDVEAARRRLREAALLSVRESEERRGAIYGETDGETIWVVRGLSEDTYVDTLLHEAMHDTVFVHRPTRSGKEKGLSCEVEHEVIEEVIDLE